MFRATDNAGKEVKVDPKSDAYEYLIVDKVIGLVKQLDAIMAAKTDDAAAQRNHEILSFALRVMMDASDKLKTAQTAGIMKAVKILNDFRANKAKYVGDMQQLAGNLGKVEITADTLDLWRELQKWLQELHDFTANVLFEQGHQRDPDDQTFVKSFDKKDEPKADNAVVIPAELAMLEEKDMKGDSPLPANVLSYPTINAADGFFKFRTGGISKYSLIYNYGVAAKLLGNNIKNYESEHKPAPVSSPQP